MCGLTGIIDLEKKFTNDQTINYHTSRSKEIEHRGPDKYSFWIDDSVNIALGFQRLSIQDITSNGNQPMISICKRYVLIFNGEIYNFKKLKNIFLKKGIHFKSNSDTEVFLCCITHYGIERSLELVNGMFAFALWDINEKILHLARDRIGEKPIYYGWQNNCFIFASELKAIKKFPNFDKELSKQAIDMQLKLSYVPAPYSIYKNIFKLMPATFITIKTNSKLKSDIKEKYYWSPKKQINKKVNQKPIKSLEKILRRAIEDQLNSDVPLGVFLSGGIDPSLITSIAQNISSKKINSFSIGFEEKGFNEASFSREISKYLNTDHNELIVTSNDALKIIPMLSNIYDEPFSDSSQIPTIILSKFAKQKVTVALTGDGGDEIFGGYNRHVYGALFYNRFQKLPKKIQFVLNLFLKNIPDFFYTLISSLSGISETKEKAQKIINSFNAKSLLELYLSLISYNLSISNDMHISDANHDFSANLEIIKSLSDQEQLMFWDLIFYLPNNILTKIDRASMAFSLETRAPFLDHQVVEYGLNLGINYKIKKNKNKWILKEILKQYIPNKYFDRPKAGFTIPLKLWIDGPLKDWTLDLLNPAKIKREGFLNQASLENIQKQHSTGKVNWQYQLWNILIFQSWLSSQ